jgi:hypothetical protein
VGNPKGKIASFTTKAEQYKCKTQILVSSYFYYFFDFFATCINSAEKSVFTKEITVTYMPNSKGNCIELININGYSANPGLMLD